MAESMADSAGGGGAADVTVAEVIARAHVSSAAFRERFDDREACLLAAFELGVQRAAARVVPSYRAHTRWLDAIKAGLAALLRFLEEEPALGRLVVVHSLSGGPRVLRRRAVVLTDLAAAVARGGGEGTRERLRSSGLIAEGVVGGVLTIVQNRVLCDGGEPAIDLFGPLVSVIVLPYLGAGIARRESTRPAPPGSERLSEAHRDGPLPDFGARITYRTARVLSAIADHPGASNREVAERAGIADQGQVSKLLGRLEERDLIAKLSDAGARGAPNSWRLTDLGELAVGSSDAHAALTSTSAAARDGA